VSFDVKCQTSFKRVFLALTLLTQKVPFCLTRHKFMHRLTRCTDWNIPRYLYQYLRWLVCQTQTIKLSTMIQWYQMACTCLCVSVHI